MHIPDGYLGPRTFITCYALMAPFWAVAWRKVSVKLHTFEAPHIALASAFVFVIQMFNVPVPGGTTGHVVGASVAAIALGAWPAALAVSFALLVQALIFGDGGITAFGANCLNMAVIQVLVSLAVWHLLRPHTTGAATWRTFTAAFASGYFGIIAAAFATAVEFGLQPGLEHTPGGVPLYCPYPLRIAVPAMVVSHLFIGVLEGAVTGFLVTALARIPRTDQAATSYRPRLAFYRTKGFWIAVLILLLLTPLGLLIPKWFGAGDAWGEWSPNNVKERAGLASAPSGMARFAEFWKSPVPDYNFRPADSTAMESVQYMAAAALGVLLITLGFLWLGRWQKSRMRAHPPGEAK